GQELVRIGNSQHHPRRKKHELETNKMESEKEFSAVDLTGEAPEGICPDCLIHGIIHGPTSCALVYCTHNLRGAYRVIGGEWKTLKGIERALFIDVIARGLLMGELRVDIQRDLAGLIRAEADQATKH
ncbi:MAG: hypothetical protein WA635_00250, partial [Gallionella sp.]